MINAPHAIQGIISLSKTLHVIPTNALMDISSTIQNANYAQTLSHVHPVLTPSFIINKNAYQIVPSISLQKILLPTIVIHVPLIVPPVKN